MMPTVLRELHSELSHRYTYAARHLRQTISDQLEKLGAPAMIPDQHLIAPDSRSHGVDEPGAFGISGPEDIKLLDVLKRMRERLLDLTGRNALLNYRHPRTECVRMIDEVPAQVLDRLLTQGPMSIVPLNGPDTSIEDRPTEQLAGETDAGESWHEAATESREEAARRRRHAERHARQAKLEARRRAVAERMGLNASFDLPATAHTNAVVHNDAQLQTLLFTNELEKLLRTLYRDSTTAIQETGANMLHLMFGFVEWRDVGNDVTQGNMRLAPLVLLPVVLTRTEVDLRTRTYRYTVQPTGEDWDTNVTLQVKCKKDFGFDIASIHPEEDDNLETYFSRVERQLTQADGWKLCRYISLGLVSFGKILMWRDLDPTTWPVNTPLLGNSLLREILGEVNENQAPGDPIVEPYPLNDLPEDLLPPPVIVMDADSSQHSVLINVRKGKNLVVQGPPGTGKSQTITNLIGTALSEGKKVLFVAEKKAALNVVHKRLTNADLGPFCLALHSHTSQKRQFLDDLMARLSLRGSGHQPRDVGQIRSIAEEARTSLQEHVARLHTPIGALRRTPFEILWRSRRLAAAVGDECHTGAQGLRCCGRAES